jgi:hypothetical protein
VVTPAIFGLFWFFSGSASRSHLQAISYNRRRALGAK